jgi:hypothetical protein
MQQPVLGVYFHNPVTALLDGLQSRPLYHPYQVAGGQLLCCLRGFFHLFSAMVLSGGDGYLSQGGVLVSQAVLLKNAYPI